jgi:hypothetical protein
MRSLRSQLHLRLPVFLTLVTIAVCAKVSFPQGPCGGKPCPRLVVAPSRSATTTVKPPTPPKTPVRDTGSRSHRPPTIRPPKANKGANAPVDKPAVAEPCADADLVIVCGMPGCEITLNGQQKYVTDDYGGYNFQVAAKQNYKVRVTKPGYDVYEKTELRLDCGDDREVNAALTARPVSLKIRTVPAECDIYLDNQKQAKGSDAQGLFSYLLTKPNLLIEARKQKYLSKTKSVVLKPELANNEIVLELEPLPATLRLSVNIPDAQVAIDSKAPQPVAERLSLEAGSHTLTFDALGYAPVTMQTTVAPDETIDREVRLERLPVPALRAQAETLLAKRAYDDVLKLCRYIFESDSANGAGHRLEGSVYVARGDFNNAGSHFAQALSADEPVTLRIRRHLGEKFELSKGHDMCEARLILRKTELEFQGLRNPAEDFKVPYEQVQVIGMQMKSSVAAYLGTRVTTLGKRRDYNFYSFDKELSAADKPYLEMIQRLLRPH